jgi:MioC protein
MQLNVLVASVHGTATGVAQALQMAAPDWGVSLDLLPMDGLDTSVFSRPGRFLVCTSTTGAGEVPDNAHALYFALDTQPVYLGHVRYGLIALGDSSYGDTFLGGGKLFDAKLQDLGAKRVGEICVLDACETTQPETDALTWFAQWLKL